MKTLRTPFLVAAVLSLLVGCTQTAPPTSRLETMPRHDEWIDVASGERKVRTYVVHPQRSDRAPVVIVIHENRGLTDWVRTVADQLAERGYLAIAPDFLSGMAPGGGGTSNFPTSDAAREAIGRLKPEQVMDDLRAVVQHARSIPSASQSISVAGFCWGGAKTWAAANSIDGLKAAYVFYGTGPQDAAGVESIEAPVYGFYGGDDARVNATIPKTEELMKAAGKRFEPVIYEGAGHAFMRLGEAADSTPANKKARDEAWSRWLGLLGK
ncbi:MAG TPA: dienelactone hydrolase family protein [Thermoanaerobaculia bacterium]|nr:dienelactone hydrolase family protein [Thermoanaerobaculia bacterium]